MIKSDVTFKEVDVPEDLWCECGHTAPETYKRDGSDSEPLPIRFWHMTGRGQNKIICEPCMTIVMFMARKRSDKRKKEEENG